MKHLLNQFDYYLGVESDIILYKPFLNIRMGFPLPTSPFKFIYTHHSVQHLFKVNSQPNCVTEIYVVICIYVYAIYHTPLPRFLLCT